MNHFAFYMNPTIILISCGISFYFIIMMTLIIRQDTMTGKYQASNIKLHTKCQERLFSCICVKGLGLFLGDRNFHFTLLIAFWETLKTNKIHRTYKIKHIWELWTAGIFNTTMKMFQHCSNIKHQKPPTNLPLKYNLVDA